MFVEYNPDLLPGIAKLHSRYADPARGLHPFPTEHWESIFTRPEIDPRRDVVILAGEGDAGESELRGFCWLYTKSAPSHVYLRGPFLSPDDPDADRVLDELINESVRRAIACSAGHIEGRSLYPTWVSAYKRVGFQLMGAYERWRLFPLRGNITIHSPPVDGAIRSWAGIEDLPVLMELFRKSFSDHWDYIPPKREDWLEVVSGKQFKPSLVLVGMDGTAAVGYVFGESMRDYSSPTLESAYLVSIALEPGHRGRGWGRALLSRWLRAVYDGGGRAVELDVDEHNSQAQSLYSGFRFLKLRTEEVWRKYLRRD